MTSNIPLVSIVTVNYNNSKYVIDTLNSIALQTYAATELIIVDDFSTDDSIHKIEEWLKQYNKPYKLILHESNKGVCVACNAGFKVATGKYISYIATDDIMLPDKIAIQVPILEQSPEHVAAVYSDAYLIQEDGSPRYGGFIQRCYNDFIVPPSGEIYKDLVNNNFIPGMTLLLKNEVFQHIGYFDERLKHEDWDMWLRISKKYSIIFSEIRTVKYRIRKGSLTASLSTKQWDRDGMLIAIKNLNDDPIFPSRLYGYIVSMYLNNEDDYYDYFIENKKIFKKGFTFFCLKNRISPKIHRITMAFINLINVVRN